MVIRKLVRIARALVGLVGLAWVAWAILRPPRRRQALEGVDPVTGDRYGIRITPLSAAEFTAAWARERSVERDPDVYAMLGLTDQSRL